MLVFIWKEQAFNYLVAIVTFASITNWVMILITQRKFRKRIGAEGVQQLDFKLPGARWISWVILAFLAFIVVLMAQNSEHQTALIIGPAWIVALLIAYEIKARRGVKTEANAQNQTSSHHS